MLVDEDHRRIAVGGEVARRDRHREILVWSAAELLHQYARLRPALFHIGVVARQSLQEIRRHTPQPAGRRLHHRADVTLPLGQNVDERFAVESE